MDSPLIHFESLNWLTMAPGARHKVGERAGKRIRLVEFTDVFVEHEWCLKGHVGYVLEGELEIAFESRTERFNPGDAFVIRGEAERHRARALGSVARLILVEDV